MKNSARKIANGQQNAKIMNVLCCTNYLLYNNHLEKLKDGLLKMKLQKITCFSASLSSMDI